MLHAAHLSFEAVFILIYKLSTMVIDGKKPGKFIIHLGPLHFNGGLTFYHH